MSDLIPQLAMTQGPPHLPPQRHHRPSGDDLQLLRDKAHYEAQRIGEHVEPISETSYWHVRYEPGSWLGAEPRGSIGLIGAVVSLFVLICLTFFLVGFLQLMMELHLAWIIGALCGCLTWVTLLRYKKRNVVHFDPMCFAEHRRRPWGWRRKDITLPDESVRILARAEPNLSGRMTYTVALVSGYSERPLFKETNYHRHFMRVVAETLARELSCPLDDELDHPEIYRVEPRAVPPVPAGTYDFRPEAKGPAVGLMLFGVLVLALLWLVVAPDAGVLFAAFASIIPCLFILFGYRAGQQGGSVIDLEARTVTHRVHIGEETLGKSTSFDTPDAYIVLHYESRREAGNIPLYSATLCTLTGATGLPCPPDLERTAEALFPWVHECANQLGLPIEILGAGAHRRWQALITKDAPACEP